MFWLKYGWILIIVLSTSTDVLATWHPKRSPYQNSATSFPCCQTLLPLLRQVRVQRELSYVSTSLIVGALIGPTANALIANDLYAECVCPISIGLLRVVAGSARFPTALVLVGLATSCIPAAEWR